MISVNQYIKLIEDFFKGHNMIRTVLTGSDYDFNAMPDVIYPVANIEYVTQSVQATNVADQFEITIADLYDENVPKSEYKIYSATNQIANDCITYFGNQYDVDYDLNENNISIQKFNNNVDGTAGCVFVMTFNQFREANNCITPIEENTRAFTDQFGQEF